MIELLTLGSCSLRRDGAEIAAVTAQNQRLALLSYLAVEGPVSRDNLVGIFWPEREEEKARHSLSQALYSLKKELGEAALELSGNWVGLARDVIAVDVHEIEAAGEDGRWEDIVEIYRGPFLDQFHLPDAPGFDDWRTRTRAWIGGLVRKAFAKVIGSRTAAGEISEALATAWRWAKLEPLEDEAQHALIVLLALSGDRAAALEQYDAYRSRLASELEMEPLEETVAMVSGIRVGVLPASPLLRDAIAEVAEATPDIGGLDGVERASVAQPARFVATEDIEQFIREELAPRLEIVRKLGESSTANVYLALEKTPRRQVAVKVFSPKLLPDKRARLRFEREVQAVASLTHPSIAALHWAGTISNALPYFVMEYIKGPSIAEKLRLEGKFSNTEARRLLYQLASALAAAHRRGIVHRDVQLGNILCDEESGRCLLTDFGVAAILASAEQKPVKITESGELVGDPAWMSPEQLRAEEVTERSDVYNLGLVGYQLLAEESPYETTTRQELFAAHVTQQPRALAQLRPDVDPEIGELLERCLAKNPRQRPSAAFIAKELSKPGPEPEPKPWLLRLLWRRVPQWLGAYLAGGFGAVELVDMLEGPGVLFNISLFSYLLGAPLVFILAWYHGRAGPQKVGRLEFILLSVVGFIWLAVLMTYLIA